MSNTVFKDRLMGALSSAVKNFNETKSANDAVIKAASDADFNPEQTKRLVEAFNTARTIHYYKVATDRTASFTLADPAIVLAGHFNSATEKAASATDYVDYSCYNREEESYYPTAPHIKVASAPRQDELPPFETIARQAVKAITDLRQTMKIAYDEARIMGNCAANSLSKIAEMLKLEGVDAAKDKYSRIVAATYDDATRPVIAKLAQFVPAPYRPTKGQLYKAAAAPVIDDRDIGHYCELIKEATDFMTEETNFLALAGMFGKEAAEFEQEWYSLTGITAQAPEASLSDFIDVKAAQAVQPKQPNYRQSVGPKKDDDDDDDDSWKKRKPESKPKSDPIGDYLFKGLAGSVGKGMGEFYNAGVTRMMTADVAREQKQLSAELSNLHRQIMLQDLLVNDPVLSEEPPEAVANAYSALLQASPEVANNKEIVRAVLRQSVHSVAVSPYDAEVWTKLEKNLQNIRGTAPGGRPHRDGKDK